MSQSRAFVHACLLVTPAVTAGAAVAGGADLGLRTALAAVLLVGHVAWSQTAAQASFRAMARGMPAAGAGLAGRTFTLLPLALAMVLVAGPLPTALAVGCVFGGAVLYAAVDVLKRRDAARALGASSPLVQETPC